MTKFTSGVATVTLGVAGAALLTYFARMALNYYRAKKAAGPVSS